MAKVSSDKDLLLQYIDAVSKQPMEIKNLKIQIRAEVSKPLISSTTPSIYNALDESFKNWVKNEPNRKKIKLVRDDKELISQYNGLQEKLNIGIKAVNDVSEKLIISINKAKPKIECFLNATEAVYNADLYKVLLRVGANQKKIIEILNSILKTISEYHRKRCNWAEFLMGMRKTPTSNGKAEKITRESNIAKNAKKVGSNIVKGISGSKTKK